MTLGFRDGGHSLKPFLSVGIVSPDFEIRELGLSWNSEGEAKAIPRRLEVEVGGWGHRRAHLWLGCGGQFDLKPRRNPLENGIAAENSSSWKSDPLRPDGDDRVLRHARVGAELGSRPSFEHPIHTVRTTMLRTPQ